MFFKESEGFWNDFFHILIGTKKVDQELSFTFRALSWKSQRFGFNNYYRNTCSVLPDYFFNHYGRILNLQIRIYEQEIKMCTV